MISGVQELLKNRLVGRRKRVASQLSKRHPLALAATQGLSLAAKVTAKIEIEQDDLFGVFVLDRLEEAFDFNVDIELFANLTQDALFERLVGLSLSTRELPISRQMRSLVALRYKDLPIVENDCSSHFYVGFAD
jgi:hypothetical protein